MITGVANERNEMLDSETNRTSIPTDIEKPPNVSESFDRNFNGQRSPNEKIEGREGESKLNGC